MIEIREQWQWCPQCNRIGLAIWYFVQRLGRGRLRYVKRCDDCRFVNREKIRQRERRARVAIPGPESHERGPVGAE